MNNFIANMREQRSPHERRQFALKVAGTMTALIFVAWVSTLGVRLAQSGAASAQQAASNTAATLVAVQQASSTQTLLNGYGGY